MKRISLVFLLATAAPAFCGDSIAVKLTGIIANEKRALFEIPPKDRWDTAEVLSLAAGEQRAKIELIKVSPENGTAEIMFDKEKFTIGLPKPPVDGKIMAVNFQDMSLDQLMYSYTRLIDRTVLRPSTISSNRFTLGSEKELSSQEMAELIKNSLEEKGIACRNYAEKFCFVVPTKQLAQVPAIIALRTNYVVKVETNAGPVKAEVEYNFPNIPVEQILMQYSKLVHRRYDRNARVPRRLIILRTANPLTYDEARFALEAAMALNNCKVVFVGEDSVKVEEPFLPQSK